MPHASRIPTIALIAAIAVGGVYILALTARQGLSTSFGMALMAIGTAASLSNAFLGIIVLLIVSAFDGLIKGLSASVWVLLLKDYFLALCLLTWLVRRALREPSEAIRQRLSIPIALFAAYAITEIANPNSPDVRSALAGTRAWILWLPLFFVAYDVIKTPKRLDWLLRAIVALGLIMGAYGLYQYFLGLQHLVGLSATFRSYAARYGWYTAEGTKVSRIFSTTVSPGAFASAMAFCGLLAVGGVFYWQSRAVRLAAAGTGAVCFTSMVLSGTRSAVLAAIFGGIAMVLVGRRPRLLLAAGLIAVIVGHWASAASQGIIIQRVASLWEDPSYTIVRPTYPLQKGLAQAIEHPLGVGTGTGVGVADRLQGRMERHELGMVENEFGRAFAELGIPGGLLFIYLVLVVVAELLAAQKRLREPRVKLMASGLVGASLSLLILLLVGSALYGAPAAPFFWCTVAAQLRLPQFEAQLRRPGPEAEMAWGERLLPVVGR